MIRVNSKEGYVRSQSNIEKMRTNIAGHRVDIDESSVYNALEDVFINIAKDDKNDGITYKLNTAEKECMDCFMEARNNALLWGKTNMLAETGKTKFSDEDGQALPTSDGIIAQIERFATKFVFSKLNVSYFEKALQTMVSKSSKGSGNDYVCICNTAFSIDWQRVMNAWIIAHKTDGAFLYSRGANGKIDLGATYGSYTFNGNSLAIKVDRSLDIEFPNREFAMIVDLTSDNTTGKEAMSMFTFKNGQFVHNTINGVNNTCAA